MRYTTVHNSPYTPGLTPDGPGRIPGCYALVAVQGTGTLRYDERKTVLHPNEVVLVPAEVNAWIESHGKTSFLEIWPK
jgi:quercetin dioxygenase-like cupin family protein